MSKETTIKFLPWDHPDATRLREAQQLEIDGLRPIGPGIPASAANVPVFLVAYSGDIPIGCGGLRPLASEGQVLEAEIKRLYVVPSQRSSNGRSEVEVKGGVSVAQVILEALEQAARERKWMLLKVETSRAMAQARKFYEKFGYVRCEAFGGYVGSEHSVCYEKGLEER